MGPNPIGVGDALPDGELAWFDRGSPYTLSRRRREGRTLRSPRRLLQVNFFHSLSLANPPKSMPLVPFASLFLPQEYCFLAFSRFLRISRSDRSQTSSMLLLDRTFSLVLFEPLFLSIRQFWCSTTFLVFFFLSPNLVIISFTDKDWRKEPLRLITLLCILLLFFLFYANIELLLLIFESTRQIIESSVGHSRSEMILPPLLLFIAWNMSLVSLEVQRNSNPKASTRSSSSAVISPLLCVFVLLLAFDF